MKFSRNGATEKSVQKTVNDVTVTIDYETRVPLFWNVALALSFNKRAVMR